MGVGWGGGCVGGGVVDVWGVGGWMWRPGLLPAGPGWLRMALLLSGAFPEGDSRGSRGKY